MIAQVGSLNPPKVYAVVAKFSKCRKCGPQGALLYSSSRPLCRLRTSGRTAGASTPRPCTVRTVSAWKRGLQNVAAALAGHKFAGSNYAVLAAWRLAPGPWVYVANRVDRSEEG